MPRSSKIIFLLAFVAIAMASIGESLTDLYPSGAIQADKQAVVRTHLMLFGFTFVFGLVVLAAASVSRSASFFSACAIALLVAALVLGGMKLTHARGLANAYLMLFSLPISAVLFVIGGILRVRNRKVK
jgi:hypothetical protein